jgi:DNA helicase TIP49 (TBP-interacting protein)
LLVAFAESINPKYAIDLMSISSIVAIKRKAVEIDLTDIRRSYSMFLDKKIK